MATNASCSELGAAGMDVPAAVSLFPVGEPSLRGPVLQTPADFDGSGRTRRYVLTPPSSSRQSHAFAGTEAMQLQAKLREGNTGVAVNRSGEGALQDTVRCDHTGPSVATTSAATEGCVVT